MMCHLEFMEFCQIHQEHVAEIFVLVRGQGLARQITSRRDWMWRCMWNIMSSYHPIMHWDDHVSILGHPQVVGLDRLISKICLCSSSKSWIPTIYAALHILSRNVSWQISCRPVWTGHARTDSFSMAPCHKIKKLAKCNTSATVKRGTYAHLQMKYMNLQDLLIAEDQPCRTYTLLPRRQKVSQNHHTDTKPPRILPSHVKTWLR